jgi:hypothetical protein
MNVVVKNFKNEVSFNSLEDCKECLVSDFKEKHVSIIKNRENGVSKVIFISVDEFGVITDTYTKKKIDILSL